MKTTQEKVQVMLAYDQGTACEYKQNHESAWDELYGTPDWDWTHFDYRIKQVSPLIIPWDAIKPEYKWAAKDADDRIHLFSVEPLKCAGAWGNGVDAGNYFPWPDWLNIQDPDNIDWKDSLVERPSA